jgi:hypothetical protein
MCKVIWSNDFSNAPTDGTPVWLYNKCWECEENPSGVLEGVFSDTYDDMTDGTWVVPGWELPLELYFTYTAAPTHWAHKVPPTVD